MPKEKVKKRKQRVLAYLCGTNGQSNVDRVADIHSTTLTEPWRSSGADIVTGASCGEHSRD